jgi:hypothetical protein
MEVQIIRELLPIAGKLTVVICLCIAIYYLYRENQHLKAVLIKQDETHQAILQEKDDQLSAAIDNHINDLKESYKDIQSFTDKFNTLVDKLASELRSIIKK